MENSINSSKQYNEYAKALQLGGFYLQENQDDYLKTAEEYVQSSIFNRDKDDNGTINIDEWATDITYRSMGLDSNSDEDAESMNKIFNLIDADGNGELDKDEFFTLYLYKDISNGGVDNLGISYFAPFVLDGDIDATRKTETCAGNMNYLLENGGDGTYILETMQNLMAEAKVGITHDKVIDCLKGEELTDEALEILDSIKTKDQYVDLKSAIENNLGKDVDLLDYISKCDNIDEEYKQKLLTNLENAKYDYKTSFEADSKVSNDYYEGDPYHVAQDGDIMTITNQRTGKIEEIDLEELCKNVKGFNGAKTAMKSAIQKLPAEVIIDISKESTIKFNLDNERDWERSYYSGGNNDSIQMGTFAANTIVHETGHALDYMYTTNGKNKASTELNKNITDAYESEIQQYIAAGNERYSETWDQSLRKYNEDSSVESEYYVTWNIKEMFAKSYELLMLGDCSNKECIETYFPETLEAIKEHLNTIRNSDDSKRHK